MKIMCIKKKQNAVASGKSAFHITKNEKYNDFQ